jgi:hypothetical protein
MKLISHEIPLDLIDNHQDKISDYMYVLLHKLIEDQEYAKKVGEYKKNGGIVFMDNSCYELGASLSNVTLYEWCETLNPDIVVLPDVLGNRNTTLERTFGFLGDYPHVANYGMAVAQGSNPAELIDCYAEFRDYRNVHGDPITMIGIPFVFSWVEKDPAKQAAERINLLELMDRRRIIDRNRRHHLLGTWQANEFSHYRNYGWVWSLDTSNPIMAAIDGADYTNIGIFHKPKATFDSVYGLLERDINMERLYSNVEKFRRIVNG